MRTVRSLPAILVLTIALSSCADSLGKGTAQVQTRSLEAVSPVASLDPDDPLVQDAQSLADDLGISLEEAVAIARMQDDVGAMQAWLHRERPIGFDGLYIAYRPYRIVLLIVEGDGRAVLDAIEASEFADLAGFIELRPVPFGESDLGRAQEALIDDPPELLFDSWTDIVAGVVKIGVGSPGDVAVMEEHLRNLIAAGVIDLPFDRFRIEVGLAQPA